MSSESPAVSRPPQSNSAPDGSGSETAKSVSRDGPSLSDLPDPSEKVREFLDELGDRAHLPLSTHHGRELRPECVEDVVVGSNVVEHADGSTEERDETNTYAVEWWRAVAEMLDWHADYHRSTLRLEYGTEDDPTHELLDVPLDNSWMAAYQDKERAKLKALERQTCGFETCDECETRWCEEPDEHETERVAGSFEEPVVALTGRTAAGDGRPSVDHARAIAEAWTGPNGNDGAGRSLRYVLDERLGLGSDEWVRWTQGEPHTGKRSGSAHGGNTGYHHAHDIIILDGAATSETVTAETFRTVIEAHVEKCDSAGREAHDLDKSPEEWAEGDDVGTVSVKRVEDEIEESVASYAAAYLANESKDLLERSPEYLAWAATMWATGTQKGIKSDSANHAVGADRCHHKHVDGEQEIPHGAEVRRSPCRCADAPYGPGCGRCDGRGYHIVCTMCSSPWDVEQDQTLTAHRTADGSHATAADGGAALDEQTPEQAAEEDLRERWPSARRGAVVGGPTEQRECDHAEPDRCPLCATETESPDHTVSGDVPIPESARAPSGWTDVTAGFERPPKWKAKAVVRDGEELPADGGTVDKQPLDLPTAPVRVVAMASRAAGDMVCPDCVTYYDSVGEYVQDGCECGRVSVGWLAPTEPPAQPTTLSRSEFVGAVPGRLLDAPGQSQSSAGADLRDDRGGAEGELGERAARFADENPAVPAAVVMGRFGLPPSAREAIAEVRR